MGQCDEVVSCLFTLLPARSWPVRPPYLRSYESHLSCSHSRNVEWVSRVSCCVANSANIFLSPDANILVLIRQMNTPHIIEGLELALRFAKIVLSAPRRRQIVVIAAVLRHFDLPWALACSAQLKAQNIASGRGVHVHWNGRGCVILTKKVA